MKRPILALDILRLLVVLVGLALVWVPAIAQPLTPGNPCGSAGVGKRVDGLVEPREGKPGMHVDPDGYWTTCAMPVPPKSCGSEAGAVEWTVGEHTCRAPGQVRESLEHTRYGIWRAPPGSTTGTLIEQCIDGKRESRVMTCGPTTECIASRPAEFSDDGRRTIYRWAGVLPIGQRTTATAADGSTRDIECRAGALALLPPAPPPPPPVARPCLPQSGTLDLVPFNYAGPPLNAGQAVEITVRLRCNADGSLTR